jgi:hypothetical protein
MLEMYLLGFDSWLDKASSPLVLMVLIEISKFLLGLLNLWRSQRNGTQLSKVQSTLADKVVIPEEKLLPLDLSRLDH